MSIVWEKLCARKLYNMIENCPYWMWKWELLSIDVLLFSLLGNNKICVNNINRCNWSTGIYNNVKLFYYHAKLWDGSDGLSIYYTEENWHTVFWQHLHSCHQNCNKIASSMQTRCETLRLHPPVVHVLQVGRAVSKILLFAYSYLKWLLWLSSLDARPYFSTLAVFKNLCPKDVRC